MKSSNNTLNKQSQNEFTDQNNEQIDGDLTEDEEIFKKNSSKKRKNKTPDDELDDESDDESDHELKENLPKKSLGRTPAYGSLAYFKQLNNSTIEKGSKSTILSSTGYLSSFEYNYYFLLP